VFLFALVAIVGGQTRTVWDGVYTEAQSARGREEYRIYCQSCHLEDLSGGIDNNSERVPALRRDGFGLSRRTLDNLYSFIVESMPGDAPGTLSGKTYVDVIAYILQQNGFPAGTRELEPSIEALAAIQIIRKP
jgi:cytochrome c